MVLEQTGQQKMQLKN